MKIYLASASPRRLEIMKKIGISVEVCVSGADEDADITDPEALVRELSARKARAADISGGDYCVIGADTVVSIDGMILGKPGDKEDARRMLRLLSGRRHQVYTGVTLLVVRGLDTDADIITFYEKTDVEFADMTDAEIDAYIATGDPMDKAGAYGVQSYAAPYIKAIYGDYYNVMGLPACRLYHEMQAAGIMPVRHMYTSKDAPAM